MLAVRCHQVTKRFRGTNGKGPSVAVGNVSFEVEAGETFGILGANGCGKSTLIRMMSTLLLPDEGSIHVFGHDAVRQTQQVRRLIHRVSVEAAFFKKLSAWENLQFASRLYGLSRAAVKERGVDILERLGFATDKMAMPMENLSRGMQQKVAITRAMLVQPSLLLLDEPTTGLDPKSRRQVQAYVEDARAREGITTILTTHDMQEAERLCTRVAIMKCGELIALGTPHELMQRNVNHHTLEDVFLKMAEEEDEGHAS